MIETTGQLRISPYSIKALVNNDIERIYKLSAECSDYFISIYGTHPDTKSASDILFDLPPGKSLKDKYVIGVSNQDNKLIALLEVVKDYPEKSCLWIGLLLINPKERNNGLGSKIYLELELWAGNMGIKEIKLGVIKQNEKALRFWEKLGFEIIETKPLKKFGKLEHNVIVLQRTIKVNIVH